MAKEITDANFQELLAEGKPLVVDFWASTVLRQRAHRMAKSTTSQVARLRLSQFPASTLLTVLR